MAAAVQIHDVTDKNEHFHLQSTPCANVSTGAKGLNRITLTRKFYLTFFDALGDCLVEAINFSFQEGELSTFLKLAVITRVQEKDRDKKLLKNWRPISLINAKISVILFTANFQKAFDSINHNFLFAV